MNSPARPRGLVSGPAVTRVRYEREADRCAERQGREPHRTDQPAGKGALPRRRDQQVGSRRLLPIGLPAHHSAVARPSVDDGTSSGRNRRHPAHAEERTRPLSGLGAARGPPQRGRQGHARGLRRHRDPALPRRPGVRHPAPLALPRRPARPPRPAGHRPRSALARGVRFRGVRFREVRFRGRFRGVRFRGVRFRGVRFRGVRFRGVRFRVRFRGGALGGPPLLRAARRARAAGAADDHRLPRTARHRPAGPPRRLRHRAVLRP
ncbi:pentapeptide repeat-containing protein [Streptomyces hygroscopicus]|uniref:pentapeptide repeat-containing protein n=1 Tax=Streptomyces hygroscopicus TaxID=1912 RepID=UPI00099EAB0C